MEIPETARRTSSAWGEPGVAAHALDPARAERLWEISERLVGA